MTDQAAEVRSIGASAPERPATFGAAHRNGRAAIEHQLRCILRDFDHPDLLAQGFRNARARWSRLLHQPGQQRGQLAQRRDSDRPARSRAPSAASQGGRASSGFCTTVTPPHAPIACSPEVPSSSSPLSKTPITRLSYATAALRNSTSMAGRHRFSRGPRLASTRYLFHDEMVIGPRDVDPARLERLLIGWGLDRQPAFSRERRAQPVRVARDCQMKHYEGGSRRNLPAARPAGTRPPRPRPPTHR